MTATDYDIIVIGGGLAGLSAGMYAARHGRSVLVLEPRAPGGQLINVERVEDYPGFPEGIAGFELGPAVEEQASQLGAALRLEEVRGLEPDGEEWIVATDDGPLRSGAVIFAAGTKPRELGVPGETRLYGKGVSHCASCDGPLYRGKTVGVVAGDGWAIQEAITLAAFAEKVRLFHAGLTVPGPRAMVDRLSDYADIKPRGNAAIEEVLGEDEVTGVRLRDLVTDRACIVELSGLFVYAGRVPNSELVRGLVTLDPEGRIPTDISLRTRRPGLFAAGDVRSASPGLAIAAAADGATAALAADRYLRDRERPGASA